MARRLLRVTLPELDHPMAVRQPLSAGARRRGHADTARKSRAGEPPGAPVGESGLRIEDARLARNLGRPGENGRSRQPHARPRREPAILTRLNAIPEKTPAHLQLRVLPAENPEAEGARVRSEEHTSELQSR